MASRWVIVGCRGQLGSAFEARLAAAPECELVDAVDLPEFDLSRAEAVLGLFRRRSPASDPGQGR